jgi:hypothetical protein
VPIQYPFQVGLDAQQVAALAALIAPVANAATARTLINIFEIARIEVLHEMIQLCSLGSDNSHLIDGDSVNSFQVRFCQPHDTRRTNALPNYSPTRILVELG